MSNENYTISDKGMVNLGLLFPKETVRKLDQSKGYYSRNKYVLKIVEEYLNETEQGQQLQQQQGQQESELIVTNRR